VELAVYIDLNPSFGLGKNTLPPASADLSEHARGGTISESEVPQTVVSSVLRQAPKLKRANFASITT
jgi:hypothetical protein